MGEMAWLGDFSLTCAEVGSTELGLFWPSTRRYDIFSCPSFKDVRVPEAFMETYGGGTHSCPVVPVFAFLLGKGSLLNSTKQKRMPSFSPGYWASEETSPGGSVDRRNL